MRKSILDEHHKWHIKNASRQPFTVTGYKVADGKMNPAGIYLATMQERELFEVPYVQTGECTITIYTDKGKKDMKMSLKR